MLRLTTFGGLSICTHPAGEGCASSDVLTASGQPRQLQRRSQALLAALAASRVGEMSRDTLALLLWPESRTEQARSALRQTLFRTKRDLGVEELLLGTTDLRLNPAVITSDVAEFTDALARGASERAATLYRGPFLAGFHLTDAPEFERWVEEERERLSSAARAALTDLARGASERGEHEVAAGWWSRLAALDPLDETVAIAYMESLAAAGNVAAALRHARLHETLLQSELDVQPSGAERNLVQRLRTPSSPSASIPAVHPGVHDPAPTSPAPDARVNEGGPPPVDARADRVEAGADAPMLASVSSTTTEEPSATGASRAPATSRVWWMVLMGIAGIALIAGVMSVGARLAGRSDPARSLDQTRVVVAPFDVLDPSMGLWREGMVDVLSRALDGAGPLHTVSPTTAIRAWRGRVSDDESGTAFGRATRAAHVVVGSIISSGPDSIRIVADLIDAVTGHRVAQVARLDAKTRMDRITDELAVSLIRELGGQAPGADVRRTGVGSGASLDALKAFLQGEQAFRRAQWGTARLAYEQAIALDTASPLVLHRLGMVASWERLLQDSLAASYLLRAGALNRGLGPRDSLLVMADSLAAGANVTSSPLQSWTLTRRLFTTLDEAARRYGHDPEVWFALGEARYHFGFGPMVGVSERATLAAFDSAIALDSAFAPAYLHAVEMGFNLGGAALGLRYARAYLARSPTEASHRGVRLVEALVGHGPLDSSRIARLLDTARTSDLVSARTILRRWPDEDESALRLSRVLAAGRPSEYPLFSDTGFMRSRLAQELAFRGHLAEAYRVLGPRDVPIFAELALLDAVPRETARTVFARWLGEQRGDTRLALGWWAGQRDTISLQSFAAAAVRRARTSRSPDERIAAIYDTAAAGAHLALARGDTSAGLARLLMLPDTLCPSCYVHRLTRGQLLRERHRLREAIATLDEPLSAFISPIEISMALERARAAIMLRDEARSTGAYRLVAAAWAHGDASLAPVLAEARKAVGRQ